MMLESAIDLTDSKRKTLRLGIRFVSIHSFFDCFFTAKIDDSSEAAVTEGAFGGRGNWHSLKFLISNF